MSLGLILADALVLLVIASAALVWLTGVRRMSRLGRPVDRPRMAALAGGTVIAMLVIAPPLDWLGARLFSIHMLQHLLLIAGAAPLVAWSRPGSGIAAILPILSVHPRRLEAAWAAAALFAVAILLWHIPVTHDWALRDPAAHALEHLSVFGTAIGFWRCVVFSGNGVSRGVTILIVWLISLQGAFLSAVIMFAPVQLCRSYADNPLTDQILAGLLMCIPASLLYAGSTIWALARLFDDRTSHAR